MGSAHGAVHGGTWALELWWLRGAGWVSSQNPEEQRDLAPVNVGDSFLCHKRGRMAPQGTANHQLPSHYTGAFDFILDPSQRLVSGLFLIANSIDNIYPVLFTGLI